MPPRRSPSARGSRGPAIRTPRHSARCARPGSGGRARRSRDAAAGSPCGRREPDQAGHADEARSAPGPHASADTVSPWTSSATVAGPSAVRVARQQRRSARRIVGSPYPRRSGARPGEIERSIDGDSERGHGPSLARPALSGWIALCASDRSPVSSGPTCDIPESSRSWRSPPRSPRSPSPDRSGRETQASRSRPIPTSSRKSRSRLQSRDR